MKNIKRNYMKSITILFLVSSFCTFAAEPIYLDDTDLVLADITGSNQIQNRVATNVFSTKGNAVFKFVGPGTVTHHYTNNETTTKYQNGVHNISISNDALTTWQGGNLFLKMYPQAQVESNLFGDYSLYAPLNSAGLIALSSDNLLEVKDSNDVSLSIISDTNTTTLSTGRLIVEGLNMSGNQSSGNINPYLSPYVDLMLMTKQMAVDDGLVYKQITNTNKDLTAVIDDMDLILNSLNTIKDSLIIGVNSSKFPELSDYSDSNVSDYLDSIQNKYKDINRSSHLDKLNLVVANVTPNSPANAEANAFKTKGYARYFYIGPGLVNINYENGTSESKNYSENVHVFHLINDATVTWTGGQLFLDMYPEVHKLASQQSQHWLYLPTNISNRVDIRSESDVSINDGVNQLIINTNINTSNINTGQIAIDDTSGNSVISAGNANRYLSPYANKALMPKDLAISEGLTYSEVTDENWTNQELVYQYLNQAIALFEKSRDSAKNLQYK